MKSKEVKSNIVIRAARKADALFIAECFRMAMLMEPDAEESRRFAELVCSRDDVLYSARNTIIAEVDGRRAGMLTSYVGSEYAKMRDVTFEILKREMGLEFPGMDDETQPGEYYLDSVALLPEYRGKGLGTQLIRYAMDEGIKTGLTLTLVVDPANDKARRLYESLGFKEAGTLFLFGHDYTRMVKGEISMHL